jgi:uncharacterized protein YxjI
MRYVMKQKMLSWGDDFTIRDEGGRQAYDVDGKVFSFGDRLVFKDSDGAEVAEINQRLLSWGAAYEITRGGKLAAVVHKKQFTLLHNRFSVDAPGPDDLEAEGDFLDHEYSFHRAGRVVAQVSKRWLSLTDSYAIDVNDGEDDVLILASAVVIDLVLHGDKKH